MEMWCLQRLQQMADEEGELQLPASVPPLLRDHPLRPFAFGSNSEHPQLANGTTNNWPDAWAPKFSGLCQLGGVDGTPVARYLVIENVLASFNRPCQLDLKLGYRTVEPDEFSWKYFRHTAGDMLTPSVAEGARLAGYKIWKPFEGQSQKMYNKALSPMNSLTHVFDTFISSTGYVGPASIAKMRERLLKMSAWWSETGKKQLNAVALSALMIRECEPRIGGSITVSDIQVLYASDLMHASGEGAYAVLRAQPEKAIYPKVVGSYANRSSAMGFPISDFLTDINYDSTQWMGTQFELEYSPVAAESGGLILEIWSHPSVNIGSHGGYRDVRIGQIVVPLESGTHCKVIADCTLCQNHTDPQPEVCVTISQTARESVAPLPKPIIKLIDYAHFYQKSQTPDWPEDGVDRGFLAAVTQLSRKIHELGSVGQNMSVTAAAATHAQNPMVDISATDGKDTKCARTGEEPFLEMPICERLAGQRSKMFVSWKKVDGFNPGEREVGECRMCDTLVSAGGWWSMVTDLAETEWHVLKQPSKPQWHEAAGKDGRRLVDA